ncbi:hypothetical protein E1295_07400 [Nonomuraea mesophila]|uniref:Uncharacterized protein n=1 Tax=Nonomuraea mesophila TaxID=2530382 RepID=A0A4R5FUL2_9ACTN|nr:hypothetical protein [Nonomuraea mesophila]TDE57774.1 hypothetical protein E1295_07400 [Nonomuraea mesophila]
MFTTPFDDAAGDGFVVLVVEVWPEAVALIPETASNANKTTIAACLERALITLPFKKVVGETTSSWAQVSAT